MGEYTEKDLDQVRGGVDPRFVSQSIPEANAQVDELTEEQLMGVFGGIPYEYAADLAKENEEAYRAAAIERALEAEINSGDESATVSNGAMRR